MARFNLVVIPLLIVPQDAGTSKTAVHCPLLLHLLLTARYNCSTMRLSSKKLMQKSHAVLSTSQQGSSRFFQHDDNLFKRVLYNEQRRCIFDISLYGWLSESTAYCMAIVFLCGRSNQDMGIDTTIYGHRYKRIWV